MLNIFYLNGVLWLGILTMYGLQWSDLCIELEFNLLLFVFFIIITSFLLGYLCRNCFFYEDKYNEKKIKVMTAMIIMYFLIEMIIINRKIPFIMVLNGISKDNTGYIPLSIFNIIFTMLAIYQSFCLANLYFLKKKKIYFIQYISIACIFLFMMQRQNILICLLGFVYCWFVNSFINKKLNTKLFFKFIIIIVALFIILYLFGLMGNMRYGSMWKWNDSSMITELGKMNDNFPALLPKEFFWAYIYFVSPLANLNNIVANSDVVINYGMFIFELIPEFISNKFTFYTPMSLDLLVDSLTVCTGYARMYVTGGIIGMYIGYLVQFSICTFVIAYNKVLNGGLHIYLSLIYFLLFNIFTNSLVYTTTSLIIIWCMFKKIKLKKRFIFRIKL